MRRRGDFSIPCFDQNFLYIISAFHYLIRDGQFYCCLLYTSLETVESIIGEAVEIPAKLQEFMKGEKKSLQMTKEFADFKKDVYKRQSRKRHFPPFR